MTRIGWPLRGEKSREVLEDSEYKFQGGAGLAILVIWRGCVLPSHLGGFGLMPLVLDILLSHAATFP